VASAAAGGEAHLVPLSLAWDGEVVTLALQNDSLTYRNIVSSGRARLGLGPTRDVVMIDATLVDAEPVTSAPADVVDTYAKRADWDPRQAGPGFAFIRLRPQRIQAWRESNELPGRTLMRRGDWLV
jgi:hypothetical protein